MKEITLKKLEQLRDLVLEKNKVLNLTAITDPNDFWEKHIDDSLKLLEIDVMRELCVNNAGINKEIKIIDVGTGAGFPGLPLAIYFQYELEQKTSPHFTLIDATRKKVDAVNTFISSLNLMNSEAIWARSEELQKLPEYKNKFHLVIARSVAYLPKLIEQTKDLVKPGGYMAFYKSVNEEELQLGTMIANQYSIKLIDQLIYEMKSIIFYKN